MTTAAQAKADGIAASQAATPEGQVIAFDTVLAVYAATGRPFTSDSMRDDLDAAQVPDRRRGALMQRAYKAGVIVPTGRYVPSTLPKTHGAVVREWVGAGRYAVDAFNRQHPVGTTVHAYPATRDDEPLVTHTRTPAWLLGGHTAVVSVVGCAGGIALTHIDVAVSS